jgi:iron complex outermembrane receptor protein
MKTYYLSGAAACALASFGAAGAFAQGVAGTQVAASTIEEVTIIGIGESRQVQTVAGEALSIQVPGVSPLKAIVKLPSVNFQSADAFGAYEWSARVTIRGFNQSQLGFTLDDVPLGDMTYGNHNGLHISRAISAENVGSIELAQGAGALETASANNLGGTLKFTSRMPSMDIGLLGAATYGSEDTTRFFLRLDTGELPTGATGYIGYSRNRADKWKGVGQQRHQQFNTKFVQPVGEGALTGWLNWSERAENDYQDLSLAMLDRLGYGWDNISGDWDLAVAIAEIGNNRGDTGVTGAFPGFGTDYPDPIETVDDAYFDASGLRDDVIGALTFDYPFGDIFAIRTTFYGHDDVGQGLWYTPYVPSPNYGDLNASGDDAPISIRTTEYDLLRYGTVSSASLFFGSHTVNFGVWYEDNEFNQARRFYALDRDAPQRNSLEMQSNPFFTQWEYDFTTTTLQLHIQDTWDVSEALTVNFGFKALSVENEALTIVGANKTGKIEAEENFLPQAGLLYRFDDMSEVFASYARNMRAFPSSATSGPFSASQAGFEAIKDTLKPEISNNFEVGWRFRSMDFQGVLGGYYVNFKDRLFAVPVGSGIQGNPSALSNVGGVESFGIEAAGEYRFAEHFTIFGSYAWNRSVFLDDTIDGDGVVVGETEGKRVVDTPEHMVKLDLGYDNGAFFGNVGYSFLSKRYFTYENDRSVPAQHLFELALGYRFSGSPFLEGWEIQGTVSNLFDAEFISTINSNGFPISGDSQTLLPGAPRQVFITLRKQL